MRLKMSFVAFLQIWVMRVKPFLGETRPRFQNCSNQKSMMWSFFENGICFFYQISEWRRNNLLGQQDKALKTFSIKRFVRWSIAENGFEAILKWKTNFLWVCKCSVLGFWIFLIDEVESISKESKTKLSKLLESKVGAF